MAVGSLRGPIRAAFWISPDGRDWRRVADAGAFAGARATSIAAAADGSTLVALGIAGDATTATGAVAWRSTDGGTWQRVAGEEALAGIVLHSIAAGPDGFVAVGSDLAATRAVAIRSADGMAWARTPDAPALANFGLKIEMRDIAWTGSSYVAGGHLLFGTQYPSAVIWTSGTGEAWTREADVPAFAQGKVQGVVAGGPGLVAVGSFGSPDISIPTVWVRTP